MAPADDEDDLEDWEKEELSAMWKFQGHSDAAKIMYEAEKAGEKTCCAAKEVEVEQDWREVQNRKGNKGKKKSLAENELVSRHGCDNSPLHTMTTYPNSGILGRLPCEANRRMGHLGMS